jgi:2-polyprenyl-6-hydroxyphenyl methylase/3-demethylubiquinone-9 3-methyltransferase
MMKQAETMARTGDGGSVDPREVAGFAAVAGRWWDPDGPFRPLHRLNPVRLGYIRGAFEARFGLDAGADRPFEGLAVADIGCGGGLVCEPLARLGARVTGVDAGTEAIAVARAHAETSGIDIEYLEGTAEALARSGRRFDAVTALEIVEHVADRAAFLAACCRLARPGGLLVLSTLNRTPRAFALAIVGAEYLLRWVPRGSHRWTRFVRPSELARDLRRGGARVVDVTGVVYDPLADRWRLGRDVAVNYMVRAEVD